MSFVFSKYRWTPAGEDQRARVAEWIEADPDHRGRVAPEFFISGQPDSECLVLEDERGPILFLRMERALRIHIQFAPAVTAEDKQRTREAMLEGFPWLQQMARNSGFREILFQSTVAPLIRFCEKRFGFRRSPNELVCGIASREPQQAQEKTARAEHQTA